MSGFDHPMAPSTRTSATISASRAGASARAAVLQYPPPVAASRQIRDRQAGVCCRAGQRIAHKSWPCIKQPASPLLMVSATSRVVRWRKGSLCRRLRLYRGTKCPGDFCMFTGKQFPGTTKSSGDSSAISKIPSRSHILRIRFNHPDGTCASRLRPGQSAQ